MQPIELTARFCLAMVGKRYWDVRIGREVYVGVANVDIKNIYERPSQFFQIH